MDRRFSFEKALAYPFSAPKPVSFMAKFGLSYALVWLGLFGLTAFLTRDRLAEIIEAFGADSPADVTLSLMAPLAVWLALCAWVIWAMFEAASQRRYIWHKDFSLGFGADELRMMGTGLWWFLFSFVLFVVPILILLGLYLTVSLSDGGTNSTEWAAGSVLIMTGLIFLLFPVYVFFATRLAPCFGQTAKDRRVRFFDAWNSSRGRFWPILGAYVILSIGGGVVSQVISGIGQLLFFPAMMEFQSADSLETYDSWTAILSSPQFLIPFVIYLFIVFFLQGVMQHLVGGPAAFAARHDPRGGVEDLERVDAFS